MADLNFQFTCYDVEKGSSVTKDFSSENLDTIIKEFDYFLKGAGFEYPGKLGLELYLDGQPEVEVSNG
jgi:hypothetical protein